MEKPSEHRLVQEPSPTLIKWLSGLKALPPGVVLDAPCGYGRNALWLSQFGRPVVCVDNDAEALHAIAQLDTTLKPSAECTPLEPLQPRLIRPLLPVYFDLTSKEWPFLSATFSIIVNVHFVDPSLFQKLLLSLRPGGYLYCETFGGQGMNHFHLPQEGQWKALLERWLEFKFYQESAVGPPNRRAVSVKFLGRKREDCPNIEQWGINNMST